MSHASGAGIEGVLASECVRGLGAQARTDDAHARQRGSHASGAGIEGVPASECLGVWGRKPVRDDAHARQRVSHASGVGIEGVPASECVRGLGTKSPDQELEPAIRIEPIDLLITNQLLYQLSYAGIEEGIL